MIIATTSDIHSPIGFDLFVKSLDKLKADPDLFLMPGDMIHKGQTDEFKKISNALFGRISCPIICCFGNNEYHDLRKKIIEENKDFIFLEDDVYETKIDGKKVGILGTQGSLDSPTPWQRENIDGIEITYNERIDLIRDTLASMKKDFKILLIHYPPTHKLLKGDTRGTFQFLASSKLEPVIIDTKPNLVVTGHVHGGEKLAWIDSIPVFNVGLKVNEKIVVIDTDELKPGLEKFLN